MIAMKKKPTKPRNHMRRVSFELPTEHWPRLVVLVKQKDLSVSRFLRRLVKIELDKAAES